mmetsp:Transcript_7273/g.9488  ORF Transcript_7273/g.9488 Transcript_7273/m.9488 type:complete len:270 (-) Transcript_7273:266-1075(-)|eukprot:CAMPEP_0198145856 /NCGR_PEP_ID=MMETSP1443-20131203/25790_1 /TAXON_ID=186043 /ORGANISM="Entomoneis sp., Strain CCMP2396" /LENGTH=269 /DNA_ID=CAMNT_0043809607 /DNA_START=72 /DNA_END=881 /DNA_ORIENTATION=-
MNKANNEIWSVQPTLESRNAAFLLLNLKALVKEEVTAVVDSTKTSGARLLPRLIPSEFTNTTMSISPQGSFGGGASDEEQSASEGSSLEGSSHRIRTVSVCSHDTYELGTTTIRSSQEDQQHHQGLCPEGSLSSMRQLSTPSHDGASIVITERRTEASAKPPSSKLVGICAASPVKEVLKRKFSWKNFPELEAYLVQNREQYLQYSSRLNYTSEQKQYNNKLTQGLLDLASEEGYVFEDFTFAAIRDRIRCYYKSFVQALKKKKRRKRV